MEGEVLNLIARYGLEAVLLALAINVLTGLIKLPVKAWAKKMEDGAKLTRYLVFLPVALGFILTAAYIKLRRGEPAFDKGFVTLWLTASSLSLTLYAIFEKMFPAQEKALKDYEAEVNRKLLEEIRKLTGTAESCAEGPKEGTEANIGPNAVASEAFQTEEHSEEQTKEAKETRTGAPTEAQRGGRKEERQELKRIVLGGKRNEGTETENKPE